MSKSAVKYLVFDIESVADGDLIAKLKYTVPGQETPSPEEAIAMYRQELIDQRGNDFIPHTFHVPVSVVVGKVNADLELLDLVALDEPQFRPHVITDHFWRGWVGYQMPTLVSFNGRSFDIPVLELAALRYGLSVPSWFNLHDRTYDQRRNRYNLDSHLDLHDILTNFSACRFTGGLNLVANILGKPGKMDMSGYMVQDAYLEGKLSVINDYCRHDVLDTYFVFLRTAVLMGWIDIEREKTLVAGTRNWLERQADQVPAYQRYLDDWREWQDPWPGGREPIDPVS